jgi:hypothetical protein
METCRNILTLPHQCPESALTGLLRLGLASETRSVGRGSGFMSACRNYPQSSGLIFAGCRHTVSYKEGLRNWPECCQERTSSNSIPLRHLQHEAIFTKYILCMILFFPLRLLYPRIISTSSIHNREALQVWARSTGRCSYFGEYVGEDVL